MRTESFLERLQSANESTKRRWLIGSTAIAMVIVIYIWLAYFSALVGGSPSQTNPPTDAEGGFTFWQAVKNGSAIVYEGFLDKMKLLGTILRTPREYIIQPLQ